MPTNHKPPSIRSVAAIRPSSLAPSDMASSGLTRSGLDDAGRDIYRWAQDQAGHIRSGRYDLVDVANVADEVEDVARREFEALVSNLSIVLLHMLEWDHQPARRSRSWEQPIAEHRERVRFTLEDSPSLNARADEALARAYALARRRASGQTNLPIATFPEASPYIWADIMDRVFALGQD